MKMIHETDPRPNFISAMQSEGPVEHVPVFGSTSGSVRSTSPNVQTSLSQAILTVPQQTQATAFVQPTQQSHPQIEPAAQEPAVMEVVQSSQMERPSTSTAVFGTGLVSGNHIHLLHSVV